MQATPTTKINDARFLMDLAQEVDEARAEFPTNENKLAAASKELGDLSKALLANKAGNAAPEQIWKEAVQLAAMAMRIAVEGDSSFPFNGRGDA